MIKQFRNKGKIQLENAGLETVKFQLKLGDNISVFVRNRNEIFVYQRRIFSINNSEHILNEEHVSREHLGMGS